MVVIDSRPGVTVEYQRSELVYTTERVLTKVHPFYEVRASCGVVGCYLSLAQDVAASDVPAYAARMRDALHEHDCPARRER